MNISDLIRDLKTWNDIPVDEGNTCDTVKCGDTGRKLHRVALAMFGTVEVIRQAKDWNADLLIVHEPLFYDHMDRRREGIVAREKEKLLADCGLTVFRFHDFAHAMSPDMICAGEMKYAGLKGTIGERVRFGVTSFTLKEAATAEELARKLAGSLKLEQIRIAGCTDKKGDRIACCFGSPGKVYELLETHDFILAGEIYEWQDAEMARDAAALGLNKAILVLGHETSERAGMMYMEELCTKRYPELLFRYFESGPVITKTVGILERNG